MLLIEVKYASLHVVLYLKSESDSRKWPSKLCKHGCMDVSCNVDFNHKCNVILLLMNLDFFFYQLDTEYVGVICYFKLQEALDWSLGPGLECGCRKCISSSLT